MTYVDYLNLSEDRKRMLKQQYFFDCTCDHCTNKTKDDLKMAGAVVDGVKVGFYRFRGRVCSVMSLSLYNKSCDLLQLIKLDSTDMCVI